MSGELTHNQKAALLKLSKQPGYRGELHKSTGEALVRKGYAFGALGFYQLTYTGLHFARTGEQSC